jgi:RimJ/RimL family protein N-acetyltransferase
MEKVMETERILLRPWRESDAEILFKWASDPDVGPRAGWPPHKSVEESLEIIRTVFNAEGMWAVIWKKSGEAIGCVGYLPASASNLKIAEDQAEVGYWIARPFWGKASVRKHFKWSSTIASMKRASQCFGATTSLPTLRLVA